MPWHLWPVDWLKMQRYVKSVFLDNKELHHAVNEQWLTDNLYIPWHTGA